MRVVSAESTELFVGPPDAPLQLVRVSFTDFGDGDEPVVVRVDGDGVAGQGQARPGRTVVEVPVAVQDPVAGRRCAARAQCGDTSIPFTFVVAEPGWTMFMISHFHYDPVWWNTQGAYTSSWTEDPPGRCRQTNAFNLVRQHLEKARKDPVYKFVLAEVDYLKPYWDVHPEDRAELRRLIADGRVEVMGGTYNEPSTNLTGPETTIRNLVLGMGFQRDVLGAQPSTAWQLDVFGHDPQFPGMAADAGLTSSAWARGPHHQWGPMHSDGGVQGMQFCSEFEWIAPSGRGLLTHYMPAHYSAGWWMDESASLADAEAATYRLFEELRKVALTRNVLLPVGTDFTPPNRWVTDIHRDWNSRYTWPRFVCALPRDFFAAVRTELQAHGRAPSPQTRDMNPVYTGKDVSYIDTKLANRAAENAVLDAEKFAVFTDLLGGSKYPQAALTKAWVQLAYGAHHDAITGSESDQVYLDLLTGWRNAWELGCSVRASALTQLSSAVDGDIVVWNSQTFQRTDVVTAQLQAPVAPDVRLSDVDGGVEVPVHVEHDGRSLTWLATDVPSLGWRAYRLVPGDATAPGWRPVAGYQISNEEHRLTVDPSRGGAVTSWLHNGRELIADGRVGNELAVYQEYPGHPTGGEGPWHLVPHGSVVCSSDTPAQVRAYHGPLGQRLVVDGEIAGVLRYSQTLTLWRGVSRVDCRTSISAFTGADRLLRLRWPCPVPGSAPVSEVGDAVIGRGFALLHDPDTGASVDTAEFPWTLDNPAYGWFGLSTAARVRIGAGVRAVSVAEVVAPTEALSAPLARDLMVALVRAGVTATCGSADKPRYGYLDVDSNLPDTRIALGGPGQNVFTKAVLAEADPVYTAELERQLEATGMARVWVPAAGEFTPPASSSAARVFRADLRRPGALPVLVVAARDEADLAVAVQALADDLGDAEIVVTQQAAGRLDAYQPRTVALLNRGMPSFAVDTAGTLHTALMRSCTGWPSGTWIDEPRLTAPDGSNFQLQHWTHVFDYALLSGDGDWRRAAVPAASAAFANPLLAVPAGRCTRRLPAAGSLVSLEPAGAVQVGAIKAAGNPLARGSARPLNPGLVALRLIEPHGHDAAVRIASDVGSVSKLQNADLLETPDRPLQSLNLHGYQISTVLAHIDAPKLLDTEDTARVQPAEVAQPLYARYWQHNRGPAPMGGLAAVAHLHPQQMRAEPGGQVTVRLTIASDCSDARLIGAVTLVCAPGWSTAPDSVRFDLPPGHHDAVDLVVPVPRDAAPGLYPVRAQLRLTGDDVPAAWRQVVEDVCLVSVGADERDRLLYLVDAPTDVELAPGTTAQLTVTVGSDACAGLALEAHLISPWGTWEWLTPAACGAVVPARGTVELSFDVAPPVWQEPGEWWALVRVGCAGQLIYTPTVQVTVR